MAQMPRDQDNCAQCSMKLLQKQWETHIEDSGKQNGKQIQKTVETNENTTNNEKEAPSGASYISNRLG